jgi:cytohesin
MPLFFYTTGSFLKAVSKGDVIEVTQYLQQDADWAKSKNKQGESALHLAAEKGHLDIIRLLAEYGADMEAQNRYGATPLAEAVSNGKEAAITLFLELGANPDGSGGASQLPLVLAVSRNMPRVVRQLLTAKADPNLNNPLLVAAQYNYGETGIALVEGGAKLDVHDYYYRYPLHFAASTGGFDLARAILDKGADIDVRENSNGYTPLHFAVMYGHNLLVDLLLERGARTDIISNHGTTPLELAYEKKNVAIIRMLEAKVKTAPAIAGQAAAPAPAVAPPQNDNGNETWMRMGDTRVAHVGTWPEMGRRLTEIFNFSSRERLIITENLRTGAENMSAPESFDNIAEDALKKAIAAFRGLGGTVDEDAVLNPRGIKKQLRHP